MYGSGILALQWKERCVPLFADDLCHDAPRPQPVQFDEQHGLFRPEIKPTFRKRHDHLVAQQQALKVDVRGALEAPFVPIVFARRGDFDQPLEKIVQQPRFIVRDDYGGV